MDTLLTDPSMLKAWTDVLENMPDAVFIIAGQRGAGRILYVNTQVVLMSVVRSSIDRLKCWCPRM